MTNQSNDQTVTFSDAEISEVSVAPTTEINLDALSFTEYCKRNPSASECKEYDV